MNMFKPTNAKTPAEYIANLDEPRRSEIQKIHDFIQKTVPDLKPHIMSGMLAYGTFHYKYASGREGDWAVITLASRAQYISLYVCAGDGNQYLAEAYRDRLPKADIGKSCIRYKHFEDIDFAVLEELLKAAEKSPAFQM